MCGNRRIRCGQELVFAYRRGTEATRVSAAYETPLACAVLNDGTLHVAPRPPAALQEISEGCPPVGAGRLNGARSGKVVTPSGRPRPVRPRRERPTPHRLARARSSSSHTGIIENYLEIRTTSCPTANLFKSGNR